MFTPLQKILPKAVRTLGLRREVEAALICEKYRKLAPAFIHKNALQHTFPKFFRGKTLTVGVTNPAWAAQVVSQKEKILRALNESLGGEKVGEKVERLKTMVVEKIPH